MGVVALVEVQLVLEQRILEVEAAEVMQESVGPVVQAL
jgi:hypothetical protein